MTTIFDIPFQQIKVRGVTATPSVVDPSGIFVDTFYDSEAEEYVGYLPMLMSKPKYGEYIINGVKTELNPKSRSAKISFEIHGPTVYLKVLTGSGTLESADWAVNNTLIHAKEVTYPTQHIYAAVVARIKKQQGDVVTYYSEHATIEVLPVATEVNKAWIENAEFEAAVLAYLQQEVMLRGYQPDTKIAVSGCRNQSYDFGCTRIYEFENTRYEFYAKNSNGFMVSATTKKDCKVVATFYLDLDVLIDAAFGYLRDTGALIDVLDGEMVSGCLGVSGFVEKIQALTRQICVCCSYGYYYNGQPIGFN